MKLSSQITFQIKRVGKQTMAKYGNDNLALVAGYRKKRGIEGV